MKSMMTLTLFLLSNVSMAYVKPGLYSIPGVQSKYKANSYWLEPGERKGLNCFESDGYTSSSDDVILKLRILEDPKAPDHYIGEFNGIKINLVYQAHSVRPGGWIYGRYEEHTVNYDYQLKIEAEVENGLLVGYGQYSDVKIEEDKTYNQLSCDKKLPMSSQGSRFYQGYSIYPIKHDPSGELILQWYDKKITYTP